MAIRTPAAFAAQCGPRRFARRQRGVTSIEYALIGALIALAILASVSSLGQVVTDFYVYLSERVGSVISPGSG